MKKLVCENKAVARCTHEATVWKKEAAIWMCNKMKIEQTPRDTLGSRLTRRVTREN